MEQTLQDWGDALLPDEPDPDFLEVAGEDEGVFLPGVVAEAGEGAGEADDEEDMVRGRLALEVVVGIGVVTVVLFSSQFEEDAIEILMLDLPAAVDISLS